MEEHTLDARQYSPLARWVVGHTIRARLNGAPVSDQDFEDMLQEAQIALWKTADEPQAYRFVAARNAVLHFFFRYCLEIYRHSGKYPDSTPWGDRVSLEEHITEKGEETLPAAPPLDPQPPRPLPVEGPALVTFLATTYPAFDNPPYRKRAFAGAEKDARIVELLAQGHTTPGIAHELGVTPDNVRTRRGRIRRAQEELTS